MDQVVAADGERVAVTGDDPDRQVLAGGGDAGGDRRCPAVDRVHAVGVEVVGEPRRAADPGDEDDVLPAQAELGQEALHRLQHRVVAAARGTSAPPGRRCTPCRSGARRWSGRPRCRTSCRGTGARWWS